MCACVCYVVLYHCVSLSLISPLPRGVMTSVKVVLDFALDAVGDCVFKWRNTCLRFV